MPLNIYVAASFPRRADAEQLAVSLKRLGHWITSRWIADCVGMGYANGEKQAIDDLEDVTASDCVVCITGDTQTRGGRHSEVGIALAQSKMVFLAGPREQVFHHHPLVVPLEVVNQPMSEVLRGYLDHFENSLRMNLIHRWEDVVKQITESKAGPQFIDQALSEILESFKGQVKDDNAIHVKNRLDREISTLEWFIRQKATNQIVQ